MQRLGLRVQAPMNWTTFLCRTLRMIVTSCKHQATSLHALVQPHQIQVQVCSSDDDFDCSAYMACNNIMWADAVTSTKLHCMHQVSQAVRNQLKSFQYTVAAGYFVR